LNIAKRSPQLQAANGCNLVFTLSDLHKLQLFDTLVSISSAFGKKGQLIDPARLEQRRFDSVVSID
jgi:hypothetical protein